MSNRLINETSPYLRQHAHNPVGWYPWGEEALAKARAENKLIFLSIGYSTCHWCHVMAHESFEDAGTAALLNDYFVCIKLDREERPDIDRLYMTAVQAITGRGGWPMSVWLTPEREPFYCGTYFPREQFQAILRRIHELWQARPADVREQARQIISTLADHFLTGMDESVSRPLDAEPLRLALEQLRAVYDATYGGFGHAPKFPHTVSLNFLFRTGNSGACEMVLHQLRAMATGGLFDQLGGGFHRYSVDRQWLVSHFEKMLYDQAQLIVSYVEAWQITRDSFYHDIARRTADYVLRDLTSPEGAFYSAEDADSEGVEGKFYVWTQTEIEQLLGKRAAAFCQTYGVTPAGNWERGWNVLHIVKPGEFVDERTRLLAARNQRVRPHRDEKILTGWNGLMISALAQLGDTAPAKRAADYILKRYRQGGRLYRARSIPGMLEDYAFFATGLLDLYEADFDEQWLGEATALADRMLELFYDPSEGGFFQADGRDASLLFRTKDDYDGAEPSGNSMAVLLLLRLAAVTENKRYRGAAEKTLELFAKRLRTVPHAIPQMLCALDFALHGPVEIAITGKPGAADTETLLRVLREAFLPRKVVRFTVGTNASAQVCVNRTCQLPTSDPVKLSELLRK